MHRFILCALFLSFWLPSCVSHPPVIERVVQPSKTKDNLKSTVVRDFERAVLLGKKAYLALFDFDAVGIYEKLLRRHDLLGRIPNLSAKMRRSLARDTPERYPAAREKRNLGYFFKILAERSVGSGECEAVIPVDPYAQLLGTTFPKTPPGSEPYDSLKDTINPLIANGGVVGVRCRGGKGGLALVFTSRPNQRGYDLITLYDDIGVRARSR